MRTFRRQDQLGEVISHELSDLLRTRMKDPRLGFASITGVQLSPDLRHAKVFVSVMGDEAEQRASMRALDSACGFLRHELAQRLTVRHVPEIEFHLDHSIARGTHVLNLINQMSAQSAETNHANGTAAPSNGSNGSNGSDGAGSQERGEGTPEARAGQG